MIKKALTGNEVIAEAMRQIEPDVIAAYPITPATEIVQIFSQFVADGKVKTEFIPAESEHSAISCCVGSSAAGARTMTATSSQGLALMHEILHIAPGLRLPIIMPVVNRALSSPINIHCDHSDTMNARDTGWIQIYSENVQEAYDNLIQIVRISENKNILIPSMVMTDGFVISHGMENVEIAEDRKVKDFVGEYKPVQTILDTDNPFTLGSLALFDSYFEIKRAQEKAIINSKKIILEIAEEFKRKFGREYGYFEKYKLDDAKIALVAIGSISGTIKDAVDSLRGKGKKVGLLKLRVFRPFPAEEIKEALKNTKAIGILDRSLSFSGQGGPIFSEIRSAVFDLKEKLFVLDYIYGLGGRDTTQKEIEEIFNNIELETREDRTIDLIKYVGLKN
ncbi:pyruvate ferredoxin oxidoreductase [bacterium (Candidatus Torokbacteria) CG_4_10_14_0_2_um_filter_35_8]|nr:MAG: pyruvate ferredoxin oxidoreductase [bacterium (Candidatus Torokbacteria) CG_4_10_14_0_2_um_filter_35_8]